MDTEMETPLAFASQDFIYVSDNVNCWLVRSRDISILESCGNYTQVSLAATSNGPPAVAMIRRHLYECESKLDHQNFFRARRDCLVNLAHVKEMRRYDKKRFLFVLLDGTEVIMSAKQSILFRRQKEL